jgi:hypothetical protein
VTHRLYYTNEFTGWLIKPYCVVQNCVNFVSVDASQAGEGNLEITISARGHNIPTQVHPQGNARFAVSFIPIEPTDHVISINFNKESVPGKEDFIKRQD